MAHLYAIGDTHFGHARIIEYARRPFPDTATMNEAMVDRWNATVRPDDLVVHVGDVGLLPDRELVPLLAQLRGIKVLIMGNHDRHTRTWWQRHGFSGVFEIPMAYGQWVFSHEPIAVPSGFVNVHGHLHDRPAPDDGRHRCVSVEQTGYGPVLLGDTLAAPERWWVGWKAWGRS